MNLATYLRLHRIRQAQFAKIAGVSQSTVNKAVHGGGIHRATAEQISRATGGAVPAGVLLGIIPADGPGAFSKAGIAPRFIPFAETVLGMLRQLSHDENKPPGHRDTVPATA